MRLQYYLFCLLLIKRFIETSQFETGFRIINWGAVVAVFLTSSCCLSQPAICRGQGLWNPSLPLWLWTVASLWVLSWEQGAKDRNGCTGGERGREVEKKSRLKAGNLVGDEFRWWGTNPGCISTKRGCSFQMNLKFLEEDWPNGVWNEGSIAAQDWVERSLGVAVWEKPWDMDQSWTCSWLLRWVLGNCLYVYFCSKKIYRKSWNAFMFKVCECCPAF